MIILISIFLCGIFLPAVGTFLPLAPKVALIEKRDPAEYPAARNWSRQGFEQAFNDRFGFRDALVYGHNWFSVFVCGTSPTDEAIIGKEGWLYFRSSIDDYRGLVKFPPKLIEPWRRELSAKAAYLASRHVQYLVVIAPNKETIYPEFLPAQIRQVRRRSCLDQFREALAAPQPFELLDLREPLRALKADRLFWRTDTHWNDRGALAAASEIIRHLQSHLPEIPGINPADYEARREVKPGGDLAEMIGFPNAFFEDDTILSTRGTMPQLMPTPAWAGGFKMPVKCYECDAPGRTLRAALCSDSFGIAPSRFLAAQFRRMIFIRRMPNGEEYHALLPKLVAAEKPDVLIELFTERNLLQIPKSIFSEPASGNTETGHQAN